MMSQKEQLGTILVVGKKQSLRALEEQDDNRVQLRERVGQ